MANDAKNPLKMRLSEVIIEQFHLAIRVGMPYRLPQGDSVTRTPTAIEDIPEGVLVTHTDGTSRAFKGTMTFTVDIVCEACGNTHAAYDATECRRRAAKLEADRKKAEAKQKGEQKDKA
jgi:hypothetical protein